MSALIRKFPLLLLAVLLGAAAATGQDPPEPAPEPPPAPAPAPAPAPPAPAPAPPEVAAPDPADPVDPNKPAVPDDPLPAPGAEEKRKVIAIVSDGKSPYFAERIEDWKKELLSLAEGKYGTEYRFYDAGFNPARVDEHLATVFKDPTIDVVYAAGVITSEKAAALDVEDRTKPVISGAMRFTDAATLPISKSGTSTVPNFSFITEPQRASADLLLLKKIARSSQLVVLVDAAVLTHLKELRTVKDALEKRTGISSTLVSTGGSAAAALANIPKGTRGVYVTLLSRMDNDERRKLYEGLASRGIPNVAMLGRPEIDLGAMASLRGDVRTTVARRTALNIHLVLQGTPVDALAVYLPVADRFIMNSAATRRAGWAADPDTLLTAEWAGGFPGGKGDRLGLEEVLRKAVSQNMEVLAAREGETIANEDLNIARSFLRPQVSARAEHGLTGINDPINPTITGTFTHAGRYGVELRQVLFNDELRTAADAQAVAALASRYETRSRQLDAVGDTANAYFAALSAFALLEIEQENLRLSLNNLELARLRSEIGAAAANEVNRWLQEQARARAQLFRRYADYKNSIVQLNRVSGHPREAEWTLADITLEPDQFHFRDDVLRNAIKNTRDYRRFAFYLMFLAVENAPELDGFDRQISAQGIILAQKKRAFLTPDIALVASADQVVSGGNVLPDGSQTEGFLGVNITLPLTTGGFRTAEVARQSALIRRSTYKREDALQRIEQAILNSLNAIGFSHPNIRLTRDALEAAEKQYASVEELYSQGAASLVDLLDAQVALIRQKQESAVAVYGYLTDIFALQRAIAWFEFEQDPGERARFDKNLRHFLRGGQITTANGRLLQTGFEINSAPLDANWTPGKVMVIPKAQIVPESKPTPRRSGSKLFRKRR